MDRVEKPRDEDGELSAPGEWLFVVEAVVAVKETLARRFDFLEMGESGGGGESEISGEALVVMVGMVWIGGDDDGVGC